MKVAVYDNLLFMIHNFNLSTTWDGETKILYLVLHKTKTSQNMHDDID
jgi:hypothetical protein